MTRAVIRIARIVTTRDAERRCSAEEALVNRWITLAALARARTTAGGDLETRPVHHAYVLRFIIRT